MALQPAYQLRRDDAAAATADATASTASGTAGTAKADEDSPTSVAEGGDSSSDEVEEAQAKGDF